MILALEDCRILDKPAYTVVVKRSIALRIESALYSHRLEATVRDMFEALSLRVSAESLGTAPDLRSQAGERQRSGVRGSASQGEATLPPTVADQEAGIARTAAG